MTLRREPHSLAKSEASTRAKHLLLLSPMKTTRLEEIYKCMA